MSQNTVVLPTTGTVTGLDLVNDINAAIDTIDSRYSGTSDPGAVGAYREWADTTSGYLKRRNAANSDWIIEGLLSDLGIQSGVQTYAAAAGTSDVITAAFSPEIVALADGLRVYVRASDANTTTTPTFQADSTTAEIITKGHGLPLAVGDISGAGFIMELEYDATNKWVLLNPAKGVSNPGTNAPAAIGAHSNLIVKTPAGSNYLIDITADEIVVKDSTNTYTTLRNISVRNTVNSSGLDGLDTGTWSLGNWYAIYVIWNGTTAASLISLSYTSPTLPSGYTSFARVGSTWDAARYFPSAGYPIPFVQYGEDVSIDSGHNGLTGLQKMTSGSAGNISTPTWFAIITDNFVPKTAGEIRFIGTVNNNTIMAAPRNSYGAYNSTSNPPPFVLNSSGVASAQGRMPIQFISGGHGYLYYASSGGDLYLTGWKENL